MKKNKYVIVLFLLLIFLAKMISSDESVKVMKSFFSSASKNDYLKSYIIAIDPGHGGRDPGKVGVNNILEKDINLKISLKLKKLLEDEGIQVVMTREEDIGLYNDTDSNKKRTDLNARIEIINNSNANFAISIHQNSFVEDYVKGAQVFYYGQSVEGKKLAGILQQQIKETINDGNHRQAKANENYYMIKKTVCPLVIVECGYLSNPNEADLLADDKYQDKMAKAICLGILKYIEETEEKTGEALR